jgi:hypothetical protein
MSQCFPGCCCSSRELDEQECYPAPWQGGQYPQAVAVVSQQGAREFQDFNCALRMPPKPRLPSQGMDNLQFMLRLCQTWYEAP